MILTVTAALFDCEQSKVAAQPSNYQIAVLDPRDGLSLVSPIRFELVPCASDHACFRMAGASLPAVRR